MKEILFRGQLRRRGEKVREAMAHRFLLFGSTAVQADHMRLIPTMRLSIFLKWRRTAKSAARCVLFMLIQLLSMQE